MQNCYKNSIACKASFAVRKTVKFGHILVPLEPNYDKVAKFGLKSL